MARSRRVLVLSAILTGLACAGQPDSNADDIVAAISRAASKGTTEVVYSPSHKQDYVVLVLKGPRVDGQKLRADAIDDDLVQSLMLAAPASFESALVYDDWRGTSMAWFLGSEAVAADTMTASKKGGASVTVRLQLGGSKPTISAID